MSARRSDRAEPAPAYQLEVTLQGSSPPIWRRLRVAGDTTLQALHQVLQRAMGWNDSHLYQFELDERRFAEPDPDDEFEEAEPPEDARGARLHDLGLVQGRELTYVYDFGDWWEHRIQVEAVFTPIPGEAYPCCLAGERACPPDDCGGIPGYEDLLEALRDPHHPEHESMSEWAPRGFDPEAFDLAKVNARLKALQRGKPRRPRGPGSK
jgi:hypothetical protein